jgi:tetratricopeptide (TPR) repeat protein
MGNMMIRLRQNVLLVPIFVVATLVAGTAAAQMRGDGRLYGKVVDAQGQPLQDVQVKATMTGQPAPLQAKTNKKGEWTIIGLGAGQWTLEFSKEGFESQKGPVDVDESGRTAPINVTLAKSAPKVDPNAEIQEQAQKGNALMQQEKFADARKIFEDLLVKYPSVYQLHAYIAQSYAGEKNYEKAVEHLKIAVEKEPNNAEMKMLLGDLYLEKGDKAEGQQIMMSVDLTQVKNPLPLINVAINQINESKPDDAIELLTKIATQFPNQVETYYYRGRAYIAAKKLAEAKADLEKYVSMAPPDAREMADAKKILEQLKDVK